MAEPTTKPTEQECSHCGDVMVQVTFSAVLWCPTCGSLMVLGTNAFISPMNSLGVTTEAASQGE